MQDWWGNDPIWPAYFSDGLKPPTRLSIMNVGEKIPEILRNLREAGSILVNPPCPEKNNQHYLSSKHTFLDNGPFGQSYFQLNYAGFSSQHFFPRIFDLGLPLHFCDMDLDLHLVDSCRMIWLSFPTNLGTFSFPQIFHRFLWAILGTILALTTSQSLERESLPWGLSQECCK